MPQALDFEVLLKKTQVHLRAYIAGMGVAAHEVDDLAQDVYLELYRNIDRLPGDVAPERWLKGVARNLCLNHFRRSARRGRLHREAIAEILSQLETRIDHVSTHDAVGPALDDCISRLPDDSRRIIALKYEQEWSSAAIAEACQATAEGVRVALHRLRAALRDCIAQKLARDS